MPGGKTRKQSNEPESISYGYIIIPMGVDRDTYVESCLRRGRVCVLQEGGVFRMDLYITREALQNIEFPKNPGEKGTAVVIASNPFKGVLTIIGTLNLNDESPTWSEDIFRFRKIVGSVDALIEINPKNNFINININSSEKTSIEIEATGNEESEVKLNSSGKVRVSADKSINIIGYNEINASVINIDKPKEEIRSVVMDLEKIEVTRKTENGKTSTIVLDDNQLAVTFKDNEEKVQIDSENILISFKNGQESIEMKENEINLKTGKTFKVNGGTYSFTKGETLISRIDELQTQISLLKEAFMLGANAVPVPPTTEGGVAKTSFTVAYNSLSSVTKIDFNDIKSDVSYSD